MSENRGSRRTLPVEPLTREAFAPYGQVIDTAGVEPVVINDGTSLKYPDLATVELVGGGDAAVSIYEPQARVLPMPLLELERHPLGGQAFIPLRPTRYLVVVAGAGDVPRLEHLRAYLAIGQQGVLLRPGVWHHGFLALEPSALLIVERKASEGNLEVASVASWGVEIAPP